ncbi:MAG: penicillin-binding protein 2 [bacterium]
MATQQFKDYRIESRRFTARAIFAALFVIAALGLLIARAIQLQVLDYEHFQTLSQDNRVKLVPLPPTRGLILDRNNTPLAINQPAYSLDLIPEQIDSIDDTIARLQQIIEITTADLERFEKLRKQRRRFERIPLRVDLGQEEVARISVNQHLFKGVEINARLQRTYENGDATAHALGYVGRISKKDLEEISASDYAGTTHIGKIGLEKTYEAILHGTVGLQQVEVNVLGKPVRVLEQTQPKPGKDLHLHLDAKLQHVAINALGEHNGAVVAIDPNNGGVLALVSKPGFDPNLFVEGISSKNYRDLQQDQDKPLYNRALRGQYPPGSTVKPFVGLAGLEKATMASDTTKFCPGFYQLPGHSHKFRDWKKTGHGKTDVHKAIVESCDVYFYHLAHQMGIDELQVYLKQYRFGEKTGIDLIGEKTGIRPSREWKRTARKEPWYPGETVIVGIGQGAFLTTPLQLAAATAVIANGGTYHSPRLVRTIHDSDNNTWQVNPVSEPLPPIDEHNLETIRQAMTDVTEGERGTAKRIRNEHYRIAGKTGTAQVFTVKQDEEYNEEEVAKKMRDHALFVAYAPIENPQIAIAVIVENGGHGGSTAAPIAKAVMDAYLVKEPS